ncbi:hypothetical protein C8A05DRAFT_31205 [Staphylotrichum tortipilum]|uniref:Pre-mRNA-splicing factor 38B n=1 Tax=Staphylotrichum tortipilum TaxID=2831512 RepID=A0AAN6MQ17_9PEZI|nr:hypothetical protein C8A05DRAFT_31205 [Staphylotrichum longicolle]
MEKHRLPNDTILTDDAVAELLAKEASDASIKYSSLGLEAFRSAKPSTKAKPNTRFLGRIIKETTSHNAALLAKEAAEAQARLDDLTETEERKRRRLNPSASDIRRRQLGNISSILEGRKRPSGAERPQKGADKDQARDQSPDWDRRRSKHHHRGEDKGEGHRSHKKHSDRAADERRHRRRRSCSPRQGDRSHRERSPLSSSGDDNQSSRHSRSRRGKSRKDDDLIGHQSSRHRNFGRLREDNSPLPDPSSTGRSIEDDDSDPLNELIGPAPPSRSLVRTRGRGAARGTAAMDSRFSEDYDPASDVQLEPAETDDWDEAVEAHRDRQKWKQQGADRLRAAGFTDEQIKQWEKGGEKGVDDVRWTKAGEKREWDRGKEQNEL